MPIGANPSTNRSAALPSGAAAGAKTTSAVDPYDTVSPADHAPRSTAAVCQCGGSGTPATSPSPRPQPSTSRLAVLATQLASVPGDSAVRSPLASAECVERG